jgi:hypothetical protein
VLRWKRWRPGNVVKEVKGRVVLAAGLDRCNGGGGTLPVRVKI